MCTQESLLIGSGDHIRCWTWFSQMPYIAYFPNCGNLPFNCVDHVFNCLRCSKCMAPVKYFWCLQCSRSYNQNCGENETVIGINEFENVGTICREGKQTIDKGHNGKKIGSCDFPSLERMLPFSNNYVFSFLLWVNFLFSFLVVMLKLQGSGRSVARRSMFTSLRVCLLFWGTALCLEMVM